MRDLAEYREVEAYAAIGSEMDAETQRKLTRGARLVEILKQPKYLPLPMEKQVTILYAGTKGHLDEYPVDVLEKFEAGLYNFIEEECRVVLFSTDDGEPDGSEEGWLEGDDLDWVASVRFSHERMAQFERLFRETLGENWIAANSQEWTPRYWNASKTHTKYYCPDTAIGSQFV